MIKHKTTFQVTWRDEDNDGIPFYPYFYKWMDQASGELFYFLKTYYNQLNKVQIEFPIEEARCEFKSSVYSGDVIHLMTTIVEIREKGVKLEHAFYREETIIAVGFERRSWAVLSEQKLKPIPIPNRIYEVMISMIMLDSHE